MKNKIIILPCIAAVAIATYVGKKTFESHANETSSLLMQNVEALSSGDNDSNGTSKCEGLLGICTFSCKHCGYSYRSLGSTFTNNHSCTQK